MAAFKAQPKEKILAEGNVSLSTLFMIAPIGGKLYITNKRLVFNKQGVTFSANSTDVEFSVRDIKTYSSGFVIIGLFMPFPTAVKITTKDDKVYRFHCGLEKGKYLTALKKATGK